LQDDDVVGVDKVHKTVLFADTPRPATGEGVTERLRLADAYPQSRYTFGPQRS
jgi:hypothetical protein